MKPLLVKIQTLANYYDRKVHRIIGEICERRRRRLDSQEPRVSSVSNILEPSNSLVVPPVLVTIYINWETETHFHIGNAEFVDLTNLMRVMRAARRINFSIKVKRKETCQMYKKYT